MQFIRLISDAPKNAFFNMALDEAISEAVNDRISPPTLRFYEWERPSLSIGLFQKIADIDLEYCDKMSFPVVRRQTGGRAILHDAELTYSFSSLTGTSLFDQSLMNNYTVLSNALVEGLGRGGVNAKNSFKRKKGLGQNNPACFKAVSYGEITVDNKKVVGSAQKRFRDGFLQHGSLLMEFNPGELCKILKYDSDEPFVEVGSITEFAPDLSQSDLRRHLREAFEESLQVKLITDQPSKHELKRAKELEKTKYSSDEWNFRR